MKQTLYHLLSNPPTKEIDGIQNIPCWTVPSKEDLKAMVKAIKGWLLSEEEIIRVISRIAEHNFDTGEIKINGRELATQLYKEQR